MKGIGRVGTRARRAGKLALGLLLLGIAMVAAFAPTAEEGGGASSQGRLNVVLLLSDDQPLRSFELMPFLSSRRWVGFDNAIINNPYCCPSRATILTGRYSHETGIETNAQAHRFDDSSTVATWLREAGYRTGFFGKYLNHYPWDRGPRWRPPGWSRWVGLRRPAAFYGYGLNIDGRLRDYGRRPRDYLGRTLQRQAKRFIRDRRRRQPFFALIAPYAPHGPTVPDPRDRGARGLHTPLAPNVNESDVSDKPRWVRKLDPVGRKRIGRQKRRYARVSLSNDRIARSLVRLLRRRGELGRTVFIYLTDNGFSLGEHRHIAKTCGYEECIRTPMVVRYPGVAARQISEPVTNADLAPTIADIAGVRPPGRRDGRSLLPLIRGERPERDRPILIRNAETSPPRRPVPSFWGVRTERFKYVRYRGGVRELYDLEADPFELENVAGSPAYAGTEQELRQKLRDLRR